MLSARCRVIYLLDSGWRNTMEDAAIHVAALDEDTSIFGVFDGHGGKEVALFVERHFVEELKKNPKFQSKNFKDALIETFLKMDELIMSPAGTKEVASLKGGDPDESNPKSICLDSFAGCTANVTLIHKNTMYCANAGDSRTVLCRAGKPLDMSVDHKPDQQAEKNRIEKAGGFVSDGRVNGTLISSMSGNLNLSRALGDLEYKRDPSLKSHEQLISAHPDVKVEELKLDQDQFFLMGCDGVFETLNHQELLDFILDQTKGKPITVFFKSYLIGRVAEEYSGEPPRQITGRRYIMYIYQLVLEGNGCDNMTSIIIFFKK